MMASLYQRGSLALPALFAFRSGVMCVLIASSIVISSSRNLFPFGFAASPAEHAPEFQAEIVRQSFSGLATDSVYLRADRVSEMARAHPVRVLTNLNQPIPPEHGMDRDSLLQERYYRPPRFSCCSRSGMDCPSCGKTTHDSSAALHFRVVLDSQPRSMAPGFSGHQDSNASTHIFLSSDILRRHASPEHFPAIR